MKLTFLHKKYLKTTSYIIHKQKQGQRVKTVLSIIFNRIVIYKPTMVIV